MNRDPVEGPVVVARVPVGTAAALDGPAAGFDTRPDSPSARRRPPLARPALARGMVVDGKYRVLRRLGEGAMGQVVLARDLQLRRRVALKIVRPDMVATPRGRARFLSEARSMARLRHPNVISVYSFGEHAGLPYLAMEHIPGQTLGDLIDGRSGRPLLVNAALAVLGQICRGVSAIHAAGIVHRDIKPTNILLGPGMRAVVADLGLARLTNALAGPSRASRSGTPAYMAPEIFDGDSVPAELAPRADVYSIGVIAYQLLTGVIPPQLLSLDRTPLSSRIAPPSSRNQRLSPALDEVVLAALAPDPAIRTGSANDLRRALASAAPSRPAVTPRRILVVDDDEDYREVVSVVLAKTFPGVVVETVDTTAAAVASLHHYRPDLLLVDLEIAGGSGPDLSAVVSALPGPAHLPTIACARVGAATDWSLLEKLNVDRLLRKPFDPSQLITMARSLLESTGEDA